MSETLNIYCKLQQARVLLQKKNLKKSGENKFAKFKYYELSDFIPAINEIFADLKICSHFNLLEHTAELTLFNAEKLEEKITFTIPTAECPVKGCTAIQALGGLNTYCRRYLYLNALEIVESDMFDSKAGEIKEEKQPAEKQPAKTLIDDSDIYEGLKACDTSANAEAYYKKYESKVYNIDKFKEEYAKLWKALRAKEKVNG